MLREYGTACSLKLPGCTHVATEGDHVIPRSVRLDLQYVVSNGRPACRSCNARKGRRFLSRPTVDDRGFFERSVGLVGGLRPGLPPGSNQNSVRSTRKARG